MLTCFMISSKCNSVSFFGTKLPTVFRNLCLSTSFSSCSFTDSLFVIERFNFNKSDTITHKLDFFESRLGRSKLCHDETRVCDGERRLTSGQLHRRCHVSQKWYGLFPSTLLCLSHGEDAMELGTGML